MNGFYACARLTAYFILLSGLLCPRLAAQNPHCFLVQIPTVSAQADDTICLPVLARGASTLVSGQMRVVWDTSRLEVVDIDRSHSVLPDLLTSNFNLAVGGVAFGWFSITGLPTAMPDSAELFSVCLRVKPGAVGFAAVQLVENYPLFEMVPDSLPNALPFVQQIGGVHVGGNAPSNNLQIQPSCPTSALCTQANGTIDLTVAGGEPPYTFAWSNPSGFSATTEDLPGIVGGLYMVTVTDQAGATVMGQVRVPLRLVYVHANLTDVTKAYCGQPIGCATLDINAGNPPFTVTWSANALTTLENCALPPGQQQVTVTDSSGCYWSKNFTIADDSTFNIALGSPDIAGCAGGLGYVLVGVQSSDWPDQFQYLWSTGDTTTLVEGLPVGVYWVTVTAPGGCQSSGYTVINDVSTAFWNLSFLPTCPDPDTSAGSLELRFNRYANPGPTFPVLLSWSDGTTRLIPKKPTGNVLDSLVGIPSGNYSVIVADSSGCRDTAWVGLQCFAPVMAPDTLLGFYIKDEYLNPQYGFDSCVGVFARNFNDIAELAFDLGWNSSSMELTGFKNLQLPGLTAADFVVDNLTGRLHLDWAAPDSAITLPVESLLFEACFAPSGNYGDHQSVYFTPDFFPPHVLDGQGKERSFIGMKGEVILGLYFPAGPSVCRFGVLEPSCATNGLAMAVLQGCHPSKILHTYHYDGGYHEVGNAILLNTGTYQYLAQEDGGYPTNSFLIHVPTTLPSAPCVWPGDADDNRAVNHYDLLALGQAFNSVGPVRAEASLAWHGQDALDWGQTIAINATDYKHLDANGDGLISAADTLAIAQNWGRVINPALDNPFAAPTGPANGILPTVQLAPDTLAPGESAALDLSLSSPVDSVYGLAFSISYDPAVVQDNLHFEPTASWLGDPATNLLWLQRNFPQQGRLDVAVIRTDGQAVSGTGRIGSTFIVIEDNIFFGPGTEDSTRRTRLYFSGLRAAGPDALPQEMQGDPAELLIQKNTVGTAERPVFAWRQALVVAPNPASDLLQVRSPLMPIQAATLTTVDGMQVRRVENSGTSGSLALPVAGLPAGLYFLTVRMASGEALTQKVMIH